MKQRTFDQIFCLTTEYLSNVGMTQAMHDRGATSKDAVEVLKIHFTTVMSANGIPYTEENIEMIGNWIDLEIGCVRQQVARLW